MTAIVLQAAGLALIAAAVWVLFGVGWFLAASGTGLLGIGLLLEYGHARTPTPP